MAYNIGIFLLTSAELWANLALLYATVRRPLANKPSFGVLPLPSSTYRYIVYIIKKKLKWTLELRDILEKEITNTIRRISLKKQHKI